MADDVRLMLGDCLDVLPTLDAGSIDCIITDPPYPCVDREYGRMTEAEWDAMMRRLIPECRRVLKSTGSAVFILQPNYEWIGRTRPWLWEFMAWTSREWNLVEDVYWWNCTAITNAGCERIYGLLRRSVKPCVWLGPPDCYRDQESVLWSPSDETIARQASARSTRDQNIVGPSGNMMNGRTGYGVSAERGGVVPFNLIPMRGASAKASRAAYSHPAMTPPPLADWWVRYISPPGGTVLDPFAGSGTIPLAAYRRGRRAIGIEKMRRYHDIAEQRIVALRAETPLFSGF